MVSIACLALALAVYAFFSYANRWGARHRTPTPPDPDIERSAVEREARRPTGP